MTYPKKKVMEMYFVCVEGIRLKERVDLSIEETDHFSSSDSFIVLSNSRIWSFPKKK